MGKLAARAITPLSATVSSLSSHRNNKASLVKQICHPSGREGGEGSVTTTVGYCHGLKPGHPLDE